jgi:hypothetical protein
LLLKRIRRQEMKKLILSMVLVLAVLTTYSLAHMEGGMMGSGSQEHHKEAETRSTYNPCQMGSGMMGYGMMGGYGMGSGMMGSGMMGGMMGPGMMGMMRNMMMCPGMGQGMMGGGCGMMGPGMMWGYNVVWYQKFLDETVDLRRQLNSKTFEYYEALRDPKTKTEDIVELQKEIQELQRKIYEKATER